MRRLSGQWRRAGVRADGALAHPETGGVPGGVIAPVRAPVFRHPVLDAWFAREGRPRRQGRCCLMRLADALVIGCARAGDAHKRLAVRPQRVARCGLTMHPTQTALVAVRPPAAHQGSDRGNGPGTLLGLTPSWTTSPPGFWVMKRRTARQRRRRTKKARGRGGRSHRHAPLHYQYQMRCTKLRGPCQDYGMRGHFRLREEGRRGAAKAWRYWVSRRSSQSAMGGEV